MFRLEPVGEHLIEVCTNISCGLDGRPAGRRGVRAASSACARARRATTARSRCAPSSASAAAAGPTIVCGQQQAPAARQARRTCRRSLEELRRRRLRSSSPARTAAPSPRSPTTRPSAASPRSRRARALTPDEVIEEQTPRLCAAAAARSSRPGASGASSRSRDRVAPKPHYLVVNADESEPGTFKDREIMLRVPFRFLEGCLIAAHAIESKHVFVYIRGEYEGEFEVLVAALEQSVERRPARRRHDRPAPRRRRLHLRRGDGAARVARGQARPAAHEAAVPGDRRALRLADGGQQRRVDHDGDVDPRARRRRVREASASRARRARASSRSRATSPTAATTSSQHGLPLQDADLRPRRRDPGRPDAEGRDPGRLVHRDPHRRRDRRHARLRLAAGAGTAIGSAAVIVIDDRCCIVQLGVRVSQFYEHESCGKCTPCRVGTKLADADPGEDRGRARHRRPTWTCCSTSASASTASACARSATRTRSSSRATSTSSATSSRRTSTAAAARSTAARRSTASLGSRRPARPRELDQWLETA